MKGSLLGTLALAGLAALDATPVAQTLASQPLVTATLLGLLWGDWSTALAVGTVLQILAASTLPIGARTPEDYAIGGVVGAAVALLIAARAPYEHVRQAASLIGVMTGLLAASAGVPLVRWQRRRNERLARWCEAELRAGHEGALGQAQWAAVALAFAVGLAACAAWLGLASWGAPWVERESLRLAGAWHLLQPLWLGFGFAQLLHAFVQRRLERAGVFAAALVGAWLVIVAGAQ
jgi:mannose/fructose/N-acetylgalactosamine-specific phosphotransferase system component IIC